MFTVTEYPIDGKARADILDLHGNVWAGDLDATDARRIVAHLNLVKPVNIADQMAPHWHALCALLIVKFHGKKSLTISPADVVDFGTSGAETIVLNEGREGLTLIPCTHAEAAALVIKHAKDGKL